ncbi:MAG: pyruvate kinase [Bdellovibrionales bacterium]|nr:pyruvate kinase [Bdellovibrionales bacterium]
MQTLRKVKIVATIGPSSESYENLEKLIRAGMNVARLNFSHGTHEQHKKVIHNIRDISKKLHVEVAILQDLQGPKVRVGKFEGGKAELVAGETVVVTTKDILGNSKLIPTDVKTLPADVKIGSRILINDGLLELKVLSTNQKDEITAEVVYGGKISDRKGINVPDVRLSLDCMTTKDIKDLEFGLEHNVDYIALSFVRTANDIISLRQRIHDFGKTTKIISKIEMLEAIQNLTNIVRASDAVMVARGDLATEVGQSLLPGLQKKIIKEANYWKRPVITATQMLESMVDNPLPTRAEVTDVANAVLDGTDAIMLSAETASGKYPEKCIQTMSEIALAVEADQLGFYKFNDNKKWNFISESIAESACVTAKKLDASAIICLSTTGKTATFISSFRPKSPVISVTHVEEGLTSLQLAWGVYTLRIPQYQTGEQAMEFVEAQLLKYEIVKPGEKLIVTLGMPIASRAKTNALRVHVVRDLDNTNSKDEFVPFRFQKK